MFRDTQHEAGVRKDDDSEERQTSAYATAVATDADRDNVHRGSFGIKTFDRERARLLRRPWLAALNG
jgi:hypothetical protein